MPSVNKPPGWGNNGSKPASWVNGEGSAEQTKEQAKEQAKTNGSGKVDDVSEFPDNQGTETVKSRDEVLSGERATNEVDIADCVQPQNEKDNIDSNKNRKSKAPKPLIFVLIVLLVVAVVALSVFLIMYFTGEKNDSAQATESVTVTEATETSTAPTNATQAETEPTETTEPPTQPAETIPKEDGYILEYSNTRILTDSDLYYLSDRELELARNEIYARHGRLFNTDYIQQYFNTRSWYHGTVSPDEFNESVLNDIEKYNIDFIQEYEENRNSDYSDLFSVDTYTCLNCGAELTSEAEKQSGYCDSCTNAFTCSACHQLKPYDLIKGICSDCDEHCISCGARQGWAEFTNGYCATCYERLFGGYGEDETVLYGIYQGEGTEGKIYSCPTCGTSKECQGPDQYCDNCGQHFYAVD